MIGPEIGDALGAALLEVLDGGEGWHVVERDDGVVEPMPAAIYFSGYEEWADLDRNAVELVTGRVLDVGAGAGRHTLQLQERGNDVVALDVSAGAVEVCRRRGAAHTFLGSVPELAAADPEPFDAIMLMGHNVGLLASEIGAWRMFEAMRRVLVPRGVVVGTCRDPYLTHDAEHLAYHQRNLDRGRMAGQIALRVRYGRLATNWFDYLFVSPQELRGLATRSGWGIEDITEPDPDYMVVLRPS